MNYLTSGINSHGWAAVLFRMDIDNQLVEGSRGSVHLFRRHSNGAGTDFRGEFVRRVTCHRACISRVEVSGKAGAVHIAARFRTEAMINDALLKDEFVAYYQAKVDLSSGEIIGAEALCRWRNRENGFISPSTFIPIAEETGQIVHIGEVMLRSACAFAVACNQRSGKHFVVAVNISARQLMYGNLFATLLQSLQTTGCQPEWISLEITESLLLTDSGMVIDTLNSISALGIEIAIDDFGTGYSALSYLCRFPISCLKIDQSFVRNMLEDPQQEVLIRTTIKMAQGLGMKTVAEGVETKAIARRLRQMGCELGQGYLWHKPSEADALLQRLPAEPTTVFGGSRISA